MVGNEALQALRALAKSRQQAANRKVRRIEGKGVEISGTKYDPRRFNAPINKYSTRQLTKYISELDGFVSRSTQFVPDNRGRPIPATRWRAYTRAERAANKAAAQYFAEVKDIFNPNAGMTIGQRQAAVVNSEFPKTADPAVNNPFNTIKRAPRSIASDKALKALTKQQQAKVSPDFRDKFVRNGRKQANDMLEKLGDETTKKRLKGLSDKQFHILWGYTNFASNTSIRYENDAHDGGTSRASAKTDQDSINENELLINWVKTISDDDAPPPGKKPAAKRKRKYTSTKAGPIDIWTSTDAGPIDLP